MEYVTSHSDINATYGEVASALKKLGFQDVSTPERFRLVYEEHNSDINLPARPLETIFSKGNMIGYSYILYMQGVIDSRDDLAKLIEKNRLASTSKLQKQAA